MSNLFFTDLVIDDISSTLNYIEEELESPMASKRLSLELDEAYSKLEKNPYRRPLVQNKFLAIKGFRSINIKNFTLFYIIDEETNLVILHRFMYGKRDWASILTSEFEE